MMMRRPALALSLLVAVPAHAGAVLDGSNDRIDVGTVGGFGSQEDDADGWSLMCWLKSSQTSVTPLVLNFSTGAEGAPGAGNQSLWFKVQTGYTSDYTNNADHVLINFGDDGDNGVLWHQELSGVTIGSNALHHHAVTVIANGASGANTNSSATIVWYTNGTAFTSWTKSFSDGLGTVRDFTNALAIGAHRKNGGVWFDHVAGTYAECRVYTVALSANEVNEIYRGRGRDSVTRGLLRRWPLHDSACHEYVAGTACTAQNGATWSTAYELDGIRRR